MPKEISEKIFNNWIWDIIDDYSKRIEVYYGGASSGKSYGACQKVLLKVLNEKRKVLVVRKVGVTIKHSIWSLMLRLLSESGYLGHCKVNKSDFEILLPNGSMFIFKGLDDEEKVKSIEGITDIIIEEATELTADEFAQLRLRLREKSAKNKQLYLMFNPVSKRNWVYEYFFTGNAPINSKVIQTTYHDNRFLAKEDKEELEDLKTRNPAYYRIYALGEFATLDKLIFPVTVIRIISAEEVKSLDKWIGLDFGYSNDPSAIVWGYIDQNKKTIYITGEYVRRGMLNDEIAETMQSLGLHKDRSFADSSEPKSIEEIRRKGINISAAEKGPDSVIHGIEWIKQYEIIIDSRCQKVIEEFENYTWQKDKKTGEYINKPVDTYNHTIDAIRYGLSQFIKGKAYAVVRNKAVIGLYSSNDTSNYWEE